MVMIFRIIRENKPDTICDSFSEAYKEVCNQFEPDIAKHLEVNLSRVSETGIVTLFGNKICEIQGELLNEQ